MSIKPFRSSFLMMSCIALVVMAGTACNSGDTEKKAEEATEIKPVDTAPAVPDTTAMDSASTRPVKGTN